MNTLGRVLTDIALAITGLFVGMVGVTLLVGLTGGKRFGISRWKLKPHQDEPGTWVPHPGVALALEHYAVWCRQYGRPIVIRP